MDVTTIISTMGFPIAACIAMAWYVKYITDKNCTQMDELNTQHANDMKSITEAVNNNTIALTKLTEKMESK